MARQVNRLDFATKLKLVRYIESNMPWEAHSWHDIARRAEEVLQFPVTVNNVQGIAEELNMVFGPLLKSHNTDSDLKVLTESFKDVLELLHGLYQANAMDTPPALVELLRKYKL